MKRLFWIALGATAGVLIVRKLNRAADNLTPEGAADQLSQAATTISQSIREFTDEVRAGMAERDQELRAALGIADNGSQDGAAGTADVGAVEHLLATDRAGHESTDRRGTY